jgi:hypothetical protein
MIAIRERVGVFLFLFASTTLSQTDRPTVELKQREAIQTGHAEQDQRDSLLEVGSVRKVEDSARRQMLSLRPKGIFSSANHTIPTAANNAGAFGAFFKTKVSIVNVTSRNYTIYATLYRNGGGTSLRSISMAPRQSLNYDNFLQEVFTYTGAGGVELDAWFDPPGGDVLNEFAVTAEVYTDSPNGRFKTVVNIPSASDEISSTYQSFTPGIFVDSSSRTNVGCVNTASLAATVRLDLYNSTGTRLTGYTLSVPANGWAQGPIPQGVSGGYLIWSLQAGLFPDCFAVVVDNTSNDGSFLQPTKYVN